MRKLESPSRDHFLAECRYRQENGSDDNNAMVNIVHIENVNSSEQAEARPFQTAIIWFWCSFGILLTYIDLYWHFWYNDDVSKVF